MFPGRARFANGRRTTIAVALVALLALAACGPKQSEILAAESASDDNVSTPGVTDDVIKVGFLIVDQTNLQATLGFETPDSGDLVGQIETLAAYVNANGGIGGRDLEPVFVIFDALTDSATTEEKVCRTFTEDEVVFAVVLNGMFQDNARPCYASQETVMLDQTLFPLDQSAAAELAPYLYQPSMPEYGEVLTGLATALEAESFLTEDTTLGVIAIDNEQNRRVYADQLLPRLEDLGAEPADTQWIDPTSNASLQAGQNQAVLSFKERGVDRVIAVGGSRLLAFFLTIAIPQDFFPRYAVTTFDNTNFLASGNPEAMAGSVGVSVLPAVDLSTGELDFPRDGGEQLCLDILAEGGHTFAERENASETFLYCDAVLMLQSALFGAEGEEITAEVFQSGAARIGRAENASNYLAEYRPNWYAGASGYRPMRFDEDCDCFTLTGESTEFPR